MSEEEKYSQMGGELIEQIRATTGLSHEMSQVTLQTVLRFLNANVKNLPDDIPGILESLYVPHAIRNNPGIIDRSSDARELRQIFKKLTECKDDEQQRSWALHEDEGMIMENLDKLIQILKQADQSISIHVMQRDHYENVHALVLYYQMETRWSIRELLLEVFALISTIDLKAVSVLLNSILPMELVREITSNIENSTRVTLSASVVGLLWSTGEPMPVTHFDQVGESFLNVILDCIENPPNDDEAIVDVFTNLVLAYNLQFKNVGENVVLHALAKRDNAKAFTQKVVYLLNWEEDPIAVLPHEPKPPNSILKLVTDLFTCPDTAEIFYTNDVKVLIDIVTRCVTDLGSGDPRRNTYLRLIRMVIKNSNYLEHKHRKGDLQKSFTGILLEEDPASRGDQELINSILEEFPNVFN
ncbi:unnamed protein product [Allacma fusca]|uniref:SPIN90/Ldb17 leucine-rich domain-containing protein n=1 Tax=Allacma fusca TaxID=39272 RepID=A0A8J2JQ04_9HEXA|nr:unnamed protein product [Allacma fusca]